jgi:hypothetical protein
MIRMFGYYVLAPITALSRAGALSIVLVAIWIMYPFAVQTVFHPQDAIGFQAWMQGLPVSRYITDRAAHAGVFTALLVLAGLSLLQFVVTLLIYRAVKFSFETWLLALILIGGVGNGIWWLATGYWDPIGAFAGVTPLFLMVACQTACEKFGMKIIFGEGVRPQVEDA